MSIVAPKGRKHLSADALFAQVRSGFAKIPDYRLSDPDISLTDASNSRRATKPSNQRDIPIAFS